MYWYFSSHWRKQFEALKSLDKITGFVSSFLSIIQCFSLKCVCVHVLVCVSEWESKQSMKWCESLRRCWVLNSFCLLLHQITSWFSTFSRSLTHAHTHTVKARIHLTFIEIQEERQSSHYNESTVTSFLSLCFFSTCMLLCFISIAHRVTWEICDHKIL